MIAKPTVTVDAYVVTACSLEHLKAATAADEQPTRTDLALFFAAATAASFVSALSPSWSRPKVEKRSVAVASLHEAHRGAR